MNKKIWKPLWVIKISCPANTTINTRVRKRSQRYFVKTWNYLLECVVTKRCRVIIILEIRLEFNCSPSEIGIGAKRLLCLSFLRHYNTHFDSSYRPPACRLDENYEKHYRHRPTNRFSYVTKNTFNFQSIRYFLSYYIANLLFLFFSIFNILFMFIICLILHAFRHLLAF